jgi:hypothetical protein
MAPTSVWSARTFTADHKKNETFVTYLAKLLKTDEAVGHRR